MITLDKVRVRSLQLVYNFCKMNFSWWLLQNFYVRGTQRSHSLKRGTVGLSLNLHLPSKPSSSIDCTGNLLGMTLGTVIKIRPSHPLDTSTDCMCAHSVMSDSLGRHGLLPSRLLCPCNFPGNTGVGCHFLLQGIFPT